MQTAERILHNQALAIDTWYWCMTNKIKLQSSIMMLKGHEYQVDILQCNAKRQCSRKGSQMGLALALDTEIPTPDGFKYMGDIEVGDVVYGIDGKPANVVVTSPIMYKHECYTIIFNSNVGTEIVVADIDHRWAVIDQKTKKTVIKTTKELYDTKQIYWLPEAISPLTGKAIYHIIEAIVPTQSFPVRCLGVDNG